MAHAVTHEHAHGTAQLRFASFVVSSAIWAALIYAAATFVPKLAEAPPPREPPVITTVEPAPPPPLPPVTPVRNTARATEPDFTAPPVPAPFPVVIPEGPVFPPVVAPPAPSPWITEPTWLSRPGAREFDRFYPDRARERGKEGTVVLDCVVAASGALRCAVASEDPPNWGFGQAALRMVPSFRIAPRRENGDPTEGGRIRVPVAFRLH